MLRGVLAHLSACFFIVSLLSGTKGASVGLPAITESVFNAPIADIRWLTWLTPTSQALLLLSQDGLVHRSTDGGKKWNGITAQIGGSSFRVIMIVSSPADKNIVLVIGMHHEHFASTDAGATWRELKLPAGRTRSMWFHDTKPQWGLFSAWSHSCGWVKMKQKPLVEGEGDDGGVCSHTVYVTKDLGISFSKISSHVVQFDWGDAPHEDRIYFTHFKDKSKIQPKFDHWTHDVNFAYTDDVNHKSFMIHNAIQGGNKFVISHGYIIVASVADKKLGLMVSQDAGAHFEKVVMPRHLKESSYVVLDTSEAAVVLHVNHGHGIGHVYVSDITGVHYTLSLQNNVRGNTNCAFEAVMNLRGIYLANTRDPHPSDFAPAPGSKVPAGGNEESEEHLGGLSSRTQADKSIRGRRLNLEPASKEESEDHLGGLSSRTQADKSVRGRRLKKRPLVSDSWRNDTAERRLDAKKKNVRTVVSFDRGGAWTYLRPPAKDSLGDPIVCPPESCWLHMHDITEFDRFVPFYSYTNAVGIIMGTGNVGPYLTDDLHSTNTYLSRDGGLTWAEAHKGNFIYEFGNHGGLLMMADWAREAKQAYFSTNQGYSWRGVEFTTRPMNVTNILTDQKAMTTKFVVFGVRGRQGVLYHVDFEAPITGARVCKGLKTVGSLSSDYESWTPADGKSAERCLLGRQKVYTRRKQLAECLNNKDLTWPVRKKNCTCTDEDFECGPGFVREIESMTCLPEHQTDFYQDEEGHPGVCKNKISYDIDAYRKVSGDTCIGGWRPLKFTLPCAALSQVVLASAAHADPQRKKAARWFSWKLFAQAVAVLACLVLMCCLSQSTRVKNWLIGMRIKMSGQRDYSSAAKEAPSAVNDPTNIGVSASSTGYNPPSKLEEMKCMP